MSTIGNQRAIPVRRNAPATVRDVSLALFGKQLSESEFDAAFVCYIRSQLEGDVDPALRAATRKLMTAPGRSLPQPVGAGAPARPVVPEAPCPLCNGSHH
jgi:hypothetical protein